MLFLLKAQIKEIGGKNKALIVMVLLTFPNFISMALVLMSEQHLIVSKIGQIILSCMQDHKKQKQLILILIFQQLSLIKVVLLKLFNFCYTTKNLTLVVANP